jgi:hypothetical protein
MRGKLLVVKAVVDSPQVTPEARVELSRFVIPVPEEKACERATSTSGKLALRHIGALWRHPSGAVLGKKRIMGAVFWAGIRKGACANANIGFNYRVNGSKLAEK